jgi:hypothetical protein
MNKLFAFSLLILVGMTGMTGCAPRADSHNPWEPSQGEWASGVPDVPLSDPQAYTEDYEAQVFAEWETLGLVELFALPPPKPGLYFSFDPQQRKLAHDYAQFWLGCQSEAAVMGGYNSDSACGRAYIHPRFAKQLQTIFYTCASEGARAASYTIPTRLFVRHLGSYNDRPARGSSRLSMHAYARALDLVRLSLFDAQGKLTTVSTNVRDYKGANARFYDSFRQCWKNHMPKSCKSGQTEWQGSIGIPKSKMGGNNLHNDHLHLSFPLCTG